MFKQILASEIDVECFSERVNTTSPADCWEWVASCDKDGYGVCYMKGVRRKAHRVAYALAYGKTPAHLYVLHTCDNPSCCNPEHLWLGTNRQNIDDMVSKGRSLRGARNPNAKLTESQVRNVVKLREKGCSVVVIGRKLNIGHRTVSNICRGIQWSCVTGIG